MSLIPTTAPLQSKLKPVLFVHLDAGEAIPVVQNATQNLVVVKLTGGSVKSLDTNYPFETEILFGFDDLSTAAGATRTTLDCKIYLRTPSGAGVYMTYSGVVEMAGKAAAIAGNQGESHMEFEEGYITANPKFTLDGKVEEEYKWVNDEIFIARGRFLRDTEGKLKVQYYVYIYDH
ncbi:hypothetical protein BABINDRAFT_168237 [Babjeviella inositovora NRRL Y-12698]|uniref:DUF3237 domain-containing protein n=1 Tax=Babjeviella inositovora NRRL Y-12698 TaxID=984486 RepID=A0A1E3QN34_9ASCO|nr:uncharacterized protein BABINDRAFT_168237 [Babjeviella inositovora NRRL Y-12698]ODQ78502.1 hypothetical protein BABINDRAFT_168237 [Babjeviella inositovora NRRL Y-12698]